MLHESFPPLVGLLSLLGRTYRLVCGLVRLRLNVVCDCFLVLLVCECIYIADS